jgi:hypothetical protein
MTNGQAHANPGRRCSPPSSRPARLSTGHLLVTGCAHLNSMRQSWNKGLLSRSMKLACSRAFFPGTPPRRDFAADTAVPVILEPNRIRNAGTPAVRPVQVALAVAFSIGRSRYLKFPSRLALHEPRRIRVTPPPQRRHCGPDEEPASAIRHSVPFSERAFSSKYARKRFVWRIS